MNLQLTLKTKWFDMTDINNKPEDYRELNAYFYNKFCLYEGKERSRKFWEYFLINGFNDKNKITFKPFTHNIMTRGYPAKNDISRIKTFLHKGIEIGFGKPEWGAEPNKLYFIIKHGKRIQ